MKNLRLLDVYRSREWERQLAHKADEFLSSADDASRGAYVIPSPLGGALRIIASTAGGWDHISISRADGVPCWSEMEYVKRLFFAEDEWAMELHAPPAEHINRTANVLHLWRPNDGREIPIPPREYV